MTRDNGEPTFWLMTYHGITPQVFQCVQTTSHQQHGTVYSPPGANTGTATTKVSLIGTVVLSYTFDPTQQTLDYAIVDTPRVVPEGSIWSGIQSTITGCQKG